MGSAWGLFGESEDVELGVNENDDAFEDGRSFYGGMETDSGKEVGF